MKKKMKVDMSDNIQEQKTGDTPGENVEQHTQAPDEVINEDQSVTEPEKKCPEERIRGYEQELSEQKDKYLRLYAEFDNFRKRSIKERSEWIKSAESDLISALLPVLDDLERAEKAFENANDVNALKEGVLLIQNKFRNILTQKGLQEIPSLGKAFDTDMHEAIARVPAADEAENGIIKDQVEKGYYFNGKVIRYAKVVVAGT